MDIIKLTSGEDVLIDEENYLFNIKAEENLNIRGCIGIKTKKDGWRT